MYTLGLVNGLVYRDKNLQKENIYFQGEIIKKISKHGEKHQAEEVFDCKGRILFPGFIDPHVHINLDLGEFKSSDDYASASKAAALGGITTFIDFLEPVNSEHDFTDKYLKKIKESMDSNIDYSFHTTVGNFHGNIQSLVDSSKDMGITSIKLFTTYSESDRKCSDFYINELLALSQAEGMLIMCHTENDDIIKNEPFSELVQNYEKTRPVISEISEVAKLAEMAEFNKGNLYFVHMTCGSSVEMLKSKFGPLLNKSIFVESCPQYFYLNKEVYKTEEGRLYLLAPPLRSLEESEKLAKFIGSIYSIGTDHCPFSLDEKMRYEMTSKVPKGLGGLEHSFRLMYAKFGLNIIDKFTVNPAKVFNLYPRKGVIAEGSYGDVVIYNSSGREKIQRGSSLSDYTPYAGVMVSGYIESTIVRGKFVVKDRAFLGGNGKYIRRDL